MKTHIFGGIWSPSCACFALKRCAEDNSKLFDATTISTVMKNMYVDDCLKSVNTIEEGCRLAEQITQLLSNAGFRLTKWISNSREVLKTIPSVEHDKEVLSLIIGEDLPMKRALGAL